MSERRDTMPVVGGPARPRVACPTCGLRIPLDAIVALGQRRVLICNRCHRTDAWEIGVSRSGVHSIDLTR